LAAGYANLCDHVIAPSQSIADLLVEQGVEKPIEIIPTGVDIDFFDRGSGPAFRRKHGIPQDALTIGCVSRLAEEKNLPFLMDVIIEYLRQNENAWFLLAGTGPMEETLKAGLSGRSGGERVRMFGNLEGEELSGVYAAMDLFAFASQTETQGMEVTEAMAAYTPVLAVDAPGVREIVRTGENGILLPDENATAFVEALAAFAASDEKSREQMKKAARQTAESLSDQVCAEKALALYTRVRRTSLAAHEHDSAWENLMRVVEAEWHLLVNLGVASGEALFEPDEVDQEVGAEPEPN
jgi:glycosyltransferase involved in cell wall biosynthesis